MMVLRELFFDLVFLAGFASLCYGLRLWWEPSMFIIGGVLLMGMAAGVAFRGSRGS